MEVYIKDDSTQELKKQIALLNGRIQALQDELGHYRTQAAVDITDLRLAIMYMKSIGAPAKQIERLVDFLERYIQSATGR